MKFALINGNKVEATKGAKGLCSSCGSELIAKCGEVKVNHWAHKGNRNCDPWWENETDWHRSWKGKFPIAWQEVTQFDDSGEKHIADVKTQSGWVLEFQHSLLKPEERRSRNAFYPKLVWVVDGTRRKTDKKQFQEMLELWRSPSREEPEIIHVFCQDGCRLLKEWNNRNALVFFDFQEETDKEKSMFWFLYPRISSSEDYLLQFSRAEFIELQNNNNFDSLVENKISPFLEKLIKKKQIEDEREASRHRERLSRIDWLKFGRRRRL